MPDHFDDDELPTPAPSQAPDPEAAALVRIYSCLSTVERRRLGRMLQNWYYASTERKVLLEEMAREFATR